MPWFDLPYCDTPEKIDDPSHAFEDFAVSMEDVARSNQIFGGTQTIRVHLARLLKNVPPGTSVRILDIATGSADIPIALLRWGKAHGHNLTFVAVDNMAPMLQLAQTARERAGIDPSELELVRADALALPFPPGSFDVALCALAFHHLGFHASAKLLKNMDVLTTRGLIVTDLRRDWPSLIGVRAAIALMRAHPFTRHDAPASVRRAFTPPEYRKMVALSGVQQIRISSHLYYRMALVQQKMGEVTLHTG